MKPLKSVGPSSALLKHCSFLQDITCVGWGLVGASTLLDVYSFLGMGREEESGEEGGGAGCQLCGPLESADSQWGWRPVHWMENGRENSKGRWQGRVRGCLRQRSGWLGGRGWAGLLSWGGAGLLWEGGLYVTRPQLLGRTCRRVGNLPTLKEGSLPLPRARLKIHSAGLVVDVQLSSKVLVQRHWLWL